MENKRQKIKKKKREFAKDILGAYAFACIVWIQQNYVLAFMGRVEINSSVTNAIVVSLAVTILGYYSKSLGEKHSRNVNKIADDGVPFADGDENNE